MLKSAFVWPSVLIASLTLAACAPASGPLSRSASSAGSAASTTNTTTATATSQPAPTPESKADAESTEQQPEQQRSGHADGTKLRRYALRRHAPPSALGQPHQNGTCSFAAPRRANAVVAEA